MSEKIIKTIRALMAKANDPSVTLEESILYSDKVQELLAKHMLSESILTIEEQENFEQENYIPTYMDPWRQQLAMAAAKLYMVSPVFSTFTVNGKAKKGFFIFGRPSSIEVFKEMYAYLDKTIIRLSKEYGKAHKGDQKARHDFEKGAGMRMVKRINEMYAAASVKTPENAGSGLPALYENEHNMIEEFIKSKMNLRQRKSGSISMNAHSAQGAIAANNISLNGQVPNTPKTSSTLLA